VKRRVLCKTLAGNECPLLTITAFDSDPEEIRKRPVTLRTGFHRLIFLLSGRTHMMFHQAIVVTARVHPGETNSSHIVDGVVRFLTGPGLEPQQLRSVRA
jgi:hypothetical protein